MISIDKLHKLFLQSSGVSTDSRSIEQGNMFFCLKGENFNGNTFAAQALEKGASFVIVDEPEYQLNERCILVGNSLSTLQKLAYFHRNKLNIPIIGITGTNGKTTTKELIYTVLSEKYRVIATQGNLNNHIGVPLTLLEIDENNTQVAIIEMGANHVGEIAELCQIANPNLGIITNIGKAHLEGFGSVEGITQTKIALYQHVASVDGLLFVYSEDKLLIKLSKNIETVTYGKSGLYKGIPLDDNLLLKLYLPDYETDIQTQLTGNYNFPNAMAAIAVGLSFGVPIENIKSALEAYIPDNNRSQLIKKGDRTIIVDAYNANPSSMELAIRNLAKLQLPVKTLLLGDMAELGENGTAEHQQIVDLIRSFSFDYVYLIGNEFAKTNADSSWIYTDAEQLKKSLEKTLPNNATILMKGSRSMKIERFLEVMNYVF
jgi:UDP-N-acetylmuramoyl-tripeptide--D-alanyl-D-alanine ligase